MIHMDPWIKKYQPATLKEVHGQDSAIEELRNFLSESRSKGAKKSAIVYGPTGCGKTSAVYALAKETGLEIVEVNASDVRNKDSINAVVGSASQQMSLFSRGKIILIDEIDGLSGVQDRGGAQAVSVIIEKSAFPVIMAANDPFDSKLSPLRKQSKMIQFHTLNYLSIFNVLKKICEEESVKYDEESLKTLSRSSGGDMRAAINDMQIMAYDRKIDKTDVDELSQRNKTQSMINALMIILKTENIDTALRAFDDVEEDTDKRFLWMDENLPKEYADSEDLMNAYNMMSRADVFNGRIMRRQHWHFLAYVNMLLSGGIALGKKQKYKGFQKYEPTKRILKIWQSNISNAKRNSIAEKIAEKTCLSIKESKQMMPFIKKICNDKKMAQEISEEFELDQEEIAWLKQ